MPASVEARLLAHEALLTALLRTHHSPKDGFAVFAKIFPDIQRDLNKSSPDNAELAKEFGAECNRLSLNFQRSQGAF